MRYREEDPNIRAEALDIYQKRFHAGVEITKCPHGEFSRLGFGYSCLACKSEISKIELGILYDRRIQMIENWLGEETPELAIPIAAKWDRRPEGQRW